MNLALPVVSGDASHPRWRTYLVHALRVILVLALLVSVPSAAILPRDGLTPPSLSGMILAGHRIPLTVSLLNGMSKQVCGVWMTPMVSEWVGLLELFLMPKLRWGIEAQPKHPFS